jgi:pilus assembly protein Flp/PilA
MQQPAASAGGNGWGHNPRKGVTTLRDFMIRIAAQLQSREAQLRSREEGQAMVEYALILGLVSVVAIAALTAIGTNVNTIFGSIRDSLATAL